MNVKCIVDAQGTLCVKTFQFYFYACGYLLLFRIDAVWEGKKVEPFFLTGGVCQISLGNADAHEVHHLFPNQLPHRSFLLLRERPGEGRKREGEGERMRCEVVSERG